MRLTSKNELEYRYRKLQTEMAASGLDAVVVVQNADLFYFTGTIQAGFLYVPVSGEPLYLVRRDHLRARMESGLARVIPCASPGALPGLVAEHGLPQPARIGLELDVLPVNLFRRYEALYPNAAFLDASPLIRRVRAVKSHDEIHILKDAAQQADKLYRRACEVIREGMTELELAAELEAVARKEGHPGFTRMRAFNGEPPMGLVLCGPDAAVPSAMNAALGGMGVSPALGYGPGYNRIGRNEPIVIDYGTCFDGYYVDQTRIFSLGALSDRMRRAFDDMLKVQELMLSLAEERPTWGRIYDACLTLAKGLGYADNFMGLPGGQVPFIGHGIGLELDEYPFIAKGFDQELLEPGMVWAFEPKVLFPGEGAISIENTFYLTESGVKRLTFSNEEPVVL